MNYSAVFVTLAVGLGFTIFAHGRPAAGAQSYVPRLGDIMEMTQLRHFKLWYAGKAKNWRLANYELEQIKESFHDAMIFYPGLPVADMTTMAKPAAQIDAAIKSRDSAKFAGAFGELTTACNSCHQSQGYGFIVVKVPTASPFSNELFAPR